MRLRPQHPFPFFLRETLVVLGRLTLPAALLALAFAWSVGAPLVEGAMVLEGGRTVTPRLDLAVAFMPWGWPTLAALLWSPLVVFRRWPSSSDAPPRARGRPAARLVAGAVALAFALFAGVALGAGLGWLLAGRQWAVGNPAVVVALLATMLVLYLFASTSILGTGRFWAWLAAVAAFLIGVWLLSRQAGWAPAQGLQKWLAVGRLGPGTMMEAPGLAAGVVLESAWRDVSPWPGLMLWLSLAVASAVIAVRARATAQA